MDNKDKQIHNHPLGVGFAHKDKKEAIERINKPRYDKITGEEVKPINSYLTTDLDVKLDKCVMCGAKTEYTMDTHIDNRKHYIEGAGQMCGPCHQRIY
jgi:hypothetical protein